LTPTAPFPHSGSLRRRRTLRALVLGLVLLLVASTHFANAGPTGRAALSDAPGYTGPVEYTGQGTETYAALPDFPFAHNDRVAQMIASIQSGDVYSYTGHLSGEFPITLDGQSVTLQTRNGLSEIATRQATQYVYEFLRTRGLAVSYHTWSDASEGLSGRNVVGVITGTLRPDELVLITAHLDDMPEWGRAPGADDNASGSVAVMLAAASLAGHPFERTVRLVLFTGEEYGPLGSAAYAAHCRAKNENIVALLNLDMIGWDGNDDGRLILGTRYRQDVGYAHDLAIANVFNQVLTSYGIAGLHTTLDPSRDTEVDNISFWNVGYPGVLAIEDYDLEENPYYHTRNDTLRTLNLPYFTRFVQATVGTAAHLAIPGALPTPTASATPSWTATPTASRTPTPSPSATRTPTPTYTTTPWPTASHTPKPSPTPTRTRTPTRTATAQPTATASPSPMVTRTPLPTATPTLTVTPTPCSRYLPIIACRLE
jgi:hypothetical protein